MPDSRKAEAYRARASQWRREAQACPAGKDRDACLTIADGYDDLVALIERLPASE